VELGPGQARWGIARRGSLELFLDQTLILPAGLAVATVWVNRLPLLTRNHRGFVDFADREGLVLLTA
jgi:hypothetical protein